jgi:hypothetical protein
MGILKRNLKTPQFQQHTGLKIYIIIILHYKLYYTDVKLGQLEN